MNSPETTALAFLLFGFLAGGAFGLFAAPYCEFAKFFQPDRGE